MAISKFEKTFTFGNKGEKNPHITGVHNVHRKTDFHSHA